MRFVGHLLEVADSTPEFVVSLLGPRNLDHAKGRGFLRKGSTKGLLVVGPMAAVAWFGEVLGPTCVAIRWSVSRLDLFADWQGLQLTADDRHRFVCRADSLAIHEEHRELTGLSFGRRASKTLCARIYDKTVEIAHSGAGYWQDIWADRWSPAERVMRIEFEVGRNGLREFGIETPGEAVSGAGSLWAYATASWLTLRESGTEETRSRWPVSSDWQAIERAIVACGAFGIERMYDGRRTGTLLRITPGLLGYLSSYAAIAGTEDVDDTLGELARYVLALQRSGKVAFADRVAAKKRELSWR